MRFSHVQKLFQVDRGSDQDWRLVLRETCRYLEVVGGIFQPLLMGALQAVAINVELGVEGMRRSGETVCVKTGAVGRRHLVRRGSPRLNDTNPSTRASGSRRPRPRAPSD
jgi:hypothetical protein